MKKNREQKLFVVFLLMLAIFNFPILSVFQKEFLVLGIPFKILSAFGIWLTAIVLSAIIINRK